MLDEILEPVLVPRDVTAITQEQGKAIDSEFSIDQYAAGFTNHASSNPVTGTRRQNISIWSDLVQSGQRLECSILGRGGGGERRLTRKAKARRREQCDVAWSSTRRPPPPPAEAAAPSYLQLPPPSYYSYAGCHHHHHRSPNSARPHRANYTPPAPLVLGVYYSHPCRAPYPSSKPGLPPRLRVHAARRRRRRRRRVEARGRDA